MTASPERFDTLIIGAGMSGLAAGIRLALFDQRVAIVEKHSLWGGLNSFYKLGGRRLDVGLHALTNFMAPGTPGAKARPLARILRQLRIPFADLALGEQHGSEVAFPGVRLRFSNGLALLTEEIATHFPAERDGFARLVAAVTDYPPVEAEERSPSARVVLREYLRDPLLVDMLLLPLLYYGSPTPNDVAWSSFVVLFKSLYEEGFARPEGGVRRILELLRGRYLEAGGELRMRCGVEQVLSRDGRAYGLRLEDGRELRADRILSSAGRVETLRMAGPEQAAQIQPGDIGQLSFVESISILDTPPADLGHAATITFFNDAERLVYARPDEPVDYRSGVICCPGHYAAEEPHEPALRLTLLANHARWSALEDADYYALKERVWDLGHAAITRYAPDVRPHTIFKDVFTPRTIEHFTGHLNGAVYGSPRKRSDGRTPLEGLFLCGTDQGYLGIIGAMLSGVAMANRHALAGGSGKADTVLSGVQP